MGGEVPSRAGFLLNVVLVPVTVGLLLLLGPVIFGGGIDLLPEWWK
jgi:hypothetical protein